MQAIKAIKTVYKGYRFRSRLEARWAVFFDAVDVKWEYEKEGYDLGKAGRYLPDFWLPEIGPRGMFVEIKGDWPTQEEEDKCSILRDELGVPSYIVSGVPGERLGTMYCWDSCDSGGGCYDGDECSIIWPCSSPFVIVSHEDSRISRDRDLHLSEEYDWCEARYQSGGDIDHQKWASDVARSARFEHGEKPTPPKRVTAA